MLNRQPLEIMYGVYSSMSAAASRHPSMTFSGGSVAVGHPCNISKSGSPEIVFAVPD